MKSEVLAIGIRKDLNSWAQIYKITDRCSKINRKERNKSHHDLSHSVNPFITFLVLFFSRHLLLFYIRKDIVQLDTVQKRETSVKWVLTEKRQKR